MKGQIIPFDFEEQAIRVLDKGGEVWFVAADVCRALDIENARDATGRLNDDEKGVGLTDTLGGSQQMVLINEPGLYRLIFTSRKASAERFKHWVFHEVLPSIRKTGGYQQQALSVSRTLELQRESQRLLGTIAGTADLAMREYLYSQLQQLSELLGIDAPPLASITPQLPPSSEVLASFWATWQALVEHGYDLDHSKDSTVIAVNMKELVRSAQEIDMPAPSRNSLRYTPTSSLPRLLRQAVVNSRLTGGSVRCWIFEKPTHQLH